MLYYNLEFFANVAALRRVCRATRAFADGEDTSYDYVAGRSWLACALGYDVCGAGCRGVALVGETMCAACEANALVRGQLASREI